MGPPRLGQFSPPDRDCLCHHFPSAETIPPISLEFLLSSTMSSSLSTPSVVGVGGGGDKKAPVSLVSDSWLGPTGPAPLAWKAGGLFAVLPRRTNPSLAFQSDHKPLPREDLDDGPESKRTSSDYLPHQPRKGRSLEPGVLEAPWPESQNLWLGSSQSLKGGASLPAGPSGP